MSLSAESIYRQRTALAPRLTREEEVSFFREFEAAHRIIVYALCKDSLGTKYLAQEAQTYLSEMEDEDTKTRLETFKNLEARLRSKGGQTPENREAIFDFCWDPYNMNKRRIRSAMRARLVGYKTSEGKPDIKAHPQVRGLLFQIDKSEKEFMNSNARLVKHWVYKYSNKGEFMDLCQDGNLGIFEAIDRFDTTQEVAFSTYATWWVRLYMQRGFASKNTAIIVNAKAMHTLDKILKTQAHLEEEYLHPPTTEEIALSLDMKPPVVERYLFQRHIIKGRIVSLDQPLGEDDSERLVDTLADPRGGCEEREDPFRHIQRLEIRAQISKLTDERHQQVLCRLYGLDGKSPRVASEIAREMGISRQHIYNLEADALAALHNLFVYDRGVRRVNM